MRHGTRSGTLRTFAGEIRSGPVPIPGARCPCVRVLSVERGVTGSAHLGDGTFAWVLDGASLVGRAA